MNKLEKLKEEIKKTINNKIQIKDIEDSYILSVESKEIRLSKINNILLEKTEIKNK